MEAQIGDGRCHAQFGKNFIASRSAFFPDLEVFAREKHVRCYPYHVHDRWQLAWILSGTVELAHRGRSHLLCAGDAFLVAPLEAVAVGSFEAIPFGFVTLQIPAGLVSVESRSSHPNGRVFSRHDGTAMCQKLISRLILAGSGEAQQAAIDEAITLFLSRAGHSTVLAARRVREHPVVGRACSILDDALEFGLPLTALGAAVHLNHRYVISLFNNEIGLTPHQYFMSRRVDSARRMVNRGQPLNAVAAAAGYNDQSHFTREFKRAFGVTPGAYRSRHCHMDSLQSFPGVVA